jgi:uncharacterized protein (TIGR03437 family)
MKKFSAYRLKIAMARLNGYLPLVLFQLSVPDPRNFGALLSSHYFPNKILAGGDTEGGPPASCYLMLDSKLAVALLLCCPILGGSIRQAPATAAGFEETPSGYVAQEMGRTVTVWGSGAAIRAKGRNIRMEVLGAAKRPSMQGSGDAGLRNELIGSDRTRWRLGIKLSERVTAHNVYPGVDLAWYGTGSNLEYDFNLAPRADPSKIRVRIAGADHVTLNDAGDLEISDSQGIVTQKIPAAYQLINGVRHHVAARFLLAKNQTFSFLLGPYDKSEPLTIDPALQLSSYLGGKGTDEGHAATVDSNGNFYVAGLTYSTSIGNSNVLLLKIPPSGTLVQTVYGGTLGNDMANGITTDTSGNVYVVGETTSTDFPVVGPLAFQALTTFGVEKAFILGIGSNLTSVGYSAWFGGSSTDEAFAVALGPNGNLYIVGDTNSIDFLNSTDAGVLINSNAFQDSNHGGYDGFLLSMTTAGLFNFATYIGGSGDDHAFGVAVDANSYIYVTGGTSSADFPVYPTLSGEPEAFQTAYAGNEDGFVIKLESLITTETYGSTGVWSTYVGGSGEDFANGVALDASANVYITGATASSNFPVSTGAYQTTYQGSLSNGFVFALNTDGLTGLWSTFLGSSTQDLLNAIALDGSGNVYVTGESEGSNYPVTSGALQSALAGSENVVMSELNSTGTTLLFSTYLGGSGNDIGRAIALDSQANIYLAGIAGSTDFPVTTDALQPTYGGGTSDAFYAILGCPAALPSIAAGGIGNAASYSTTALSPGGIFAIFGSYFSCVPTGASSVPLPTAINGVSVQVNGTDIPLFYANDDQINAQLPYGTAVGSATITVTGAGGTSAASSLPVEAAGPGIFEIGTQAIAVNADGTLNTTTNGAASGSYISVYFTGTGPVSNAPATGAAAPTSPLAQATLPYSATIDGDAATVTFLGLAPGFVGLGQANITIPSLAAGNYPLVITIGGVASNSATITVSN